VELGERLTEAFFLGKLGEDFLLGEARLMCGLGEC
jgi:hypothetical protein